MMNKTLKSIAIFFYKKTVWAIAKRVNTMISAQIPKHEVSSLHIENARLLTTREEMLELLPKNGVVAELGVDKGDFSQKILSLNTPKKLHLVDIWATKRYNQNKRKHVEQRFQNLIEQNSVETNIGLSTEVVKEFDDNYFDWIYIDTSHSYRVTIQELELYHEKVKPGGFIAGHDYILGNWNGLVRYGVIEAVYEFCNKYNWEIIYLTSELKTNPSFAIRRISDRKHSH